MKCRNPNCQAEFTQKSTIQVYCSAGCHPKSNAHTSNLKIAWNILNAHWPITGPAVKFGTAYVTHFLRDDYDG